jgi:hypothetical protein
MAELPPAPHSLDLDARPVISCVKLSNTIPSAWLAQFNGGGHAFMAQYPPSLADLISGFLAL